MDPFTWGGAIGGLAGFAVLVVLFLVAYGLVMLVLAFAWKLLVLGVRLLACGKHHKTDADTTQTIEFL